MTKIYNKRTRDGFVNAGILLSVTEVCQDLYLNIFSKVPNISAFDGKWGWVLSKSFIYIVYSLHCGLELYRASFRPFLSCCRATGIVPHLSSSYLT